MPHRPVIGRLTDRWALLAALAFAACASRAVPASFPPSSPASDRAGEAPAAVVTASLDAEPALPDDAADPHAGHRPADDSTSAPADAAHHGGHHGR